MYIMTVANVGNFTNFKREGPFKNNYWTQSSYFEQTEKNCLCNTQIIVL